MHSYKKIRPLFTLVFTAVFIGLFFTACSTDSGDSPSLDGDLRYLVEGSEGETVYLSYNSYTSEGGTFETIGEVTIPSSGSSEGDLVDGDFVGYQLSASPMGEDNPDITLTLLSDGEVLGETSETNSDGIFTVEVGEIPHFGE